MTDLFLHIPKAMDVKEAERVVVAKPVASRPTCSGFRSFSELLAGAINAAPPNVTPENAVPAIRPKTVRFKPAANRPQPGPNSSQAELACTEKDHSSDQALPDEHKPFVVYRPLAKFVSKATVSLLANMGNFNAHSKPAPAPAPAPAPVEEHLLLQSQTKDIFKSQPNSNYQPSIPFHTESAETSNISSKFAEEEARSTLPPSCDRPSYDGYNWRKYGQKQVKGSEYPRSYYKCTHPNCPVKKKVERSLDGQIAEIVYKGEHNHSKPQPPKRSSSGTQGTGLVPEGAGQMTDDQPYINNMNEGVLGRVENQSEAQLPAHFYQHSYDPIASQGGGGGVPASSCGVSGECEEGSKGIEIEDNDFRSKRRKVEKQSSEPSLLGCESSQEPRISVQNTTDTEMVGDGFRWRKYGQKVVKGNPYPRSYYRCTSLKCNVRKHVERASDDPSAFITTYEGKHNHEMPLRNKNAATSESSKDRN